MPVPPELILETKELTKGELAFADLIAQQCPTFATEAEECKRRFVRGYWTAVKADGPNGERHNAGTIPEVVSAEGQDQKDIDEAVKEYSGTVAWRKSENVDELRSIVLPDEDKFNASWPCHIFGADEHGHLIVVERAAEIEPALLKKEMSLELALKHRARFMECLMAEKAAESESRGDPIYKHIHVVDLEGFGTKHVSNLSFLQPVLGMAGNRYPETLYKMFLINSPWIFRASWKVIQPWVHPVTRANIFILGGKSAYMPEMEKFGITPATLPEFMGGTCTPRPLRLNLDGGAAADQSQADVAAVSEAVAGVKVADQAS